MTYFIVEYTVMIVNLFERVFSRLKQILGTKRRRR